MSKGATRDVVSVPFDTFWSLGSVRGLIHLNTTGQRARYWLCRAYMSQVINMEVFSHPLAIGPSTATS